MEVASLPSEENPVTGNVAKRLLQGRPLPAILVDNHPGPRYPTFRPHQRRISLQKAPSSQARDGASTPCDSGVSFSSPEGGDPLPYLVGTATTSKSSVHSSVAKMARAKKKKQRSPAAPPSTAMGMTSGARALGSNTGTGTGASTAAVASSGAGGGQAGLMSSISSGVSSGRISEPLHRKAPAQKVSRLGQYGRAATMEGTDYSVNPEPVPFMPSNFMSSTMVKKIPIPKRHQDTFGGYECNFTGQRGVMLHTDRYQVKKQYEALKTLEGLNQRDRLLAEMAYLEDLRSVRRRREVVPHRVQLDLFLGGKKLECEERFDFKREIQRLKAMAMPERARDLFHGKGIHLPPDHMSLLPRPSRGPVDDSDSEEEVRISAPASMQRTMDPSFNLDLQSPTFERQISLTLGEVSHARSVLRGRRHHQLPSISKIQTPRSRADSRVGSGYPRVSISKQRTWISSLQTRLPTHSGAGDDPHVTPSQVSMPQTSRSAAWVEEQNQLLSRTPEKAANGEQPTKHPQKEGQLPQSGDLSQAEDKVPRPEAPSPASDSAVRLGAARTPPTEMAEDDGRSARGQARAAETGLGQDGGQQHVVMKEGEARSLAMSGRKASPPVSHTPNPLKAGMELDVSEEQVTSLRQTFELLDTDMDGHLQYHQLKSQLPKEFSRQQEWFVKQVYEITRSSAAFFGVDEFLMMTQLTNRVASLTGQAQEAFGNIDFDTLEEGIIKYVDLFQSADSSQRGRISAEALRDLLGKSQNKPAPDEASHVWNTILDSLTLDYASQVNRIEYLAHIPLFMAVAPPVPPPPPSQPSSLEDQ